MSEIDKTFTFFWKGPLSQWDKTPFSYNNITFNCCEQFMMYYKAILFNDTNIAKLILNTSNPRTIKDLGRKVKDFNQVEWDKVKENIVMNANMAKFSQNQQLLQILKNTTGLLVEASPYDKIWGIGLSEKEARQIKPTSWPGQNLLGSILTRVRDTL